MKKKLRWAMLLCPLLIGTAYGQFDQGTRFLGATVSLDGKHSKVMDYNQLRDIKSNTFNVTPEFQVGKFYKNNRMMGIGVSLKGNFYSSYNYKSNSVTPTIAPFLRQYKFLGKRFFLYLEEYVPIQYSIGKQTVSGVKNENNYFAIGIAVQPGIGFKVGKNFYVESNINLLGLNANYKDSQNQNTFTFNSAISTHINSQFSIRAAWYLN